MTDREKLQAELEECRERISDLTRALDESPAMEEPQPDARLEAELESLRRRAQELEQILNPDS